MELTLAIHLPCGTGAVCNTVVTHLGWHFCSFTWVNATWTGWLTDFQLICFLLYVSYISFKWIYLLWLICCKEYFQYGVAFIRNSLSFFAVAFVSPKCCFYTLVINIPTNSTASEVFKELFVISLKVLCKVYFKLFLDLSISCLCITYHFLKGFSSFWQAFHFLNAKFFPVIAF